MQGEKGDVGPPGEPGYNGSTGMKVLTRVLFVNFSHPQSSVSG